MSAAPLSVLQATGEVDENGNVTKLGRDLGVLRSCGDGKQHENTSSCAYCQRLQRTSMAARRGAVVRPGGPLGGAHGDLRRRGADVTGFYGDGVINALGVVQRSPPELVRRAARAPAGAARRVSGPPGGLRREPFPRRVPRVFTAPHTRGGAPEVGMTLGNDDIAAARRAVQHLEQLTASLVQRAGGTVDARRLQADVGRLGTDLDLLCGPASATAAPAPPATVPAAVPAAAPPVPEREVIADSSYTHDFWMDAEDEGLGQGRR